MNNSHYLPCRRPVILRRSLFASPLLLASVSAAIAAPPEQPTSGETPEQRAVEYLAGHVARWAPDNHCYSCHNNGDGARALLAAGALGYRFDPQALTGTLTWLTAPDEWKNNHGNDAASDKQLAAIQFAAALSAAIDVGQARDPAALVSAAQIVAGFQRDDGSWHVGADGTVGSPATYGPVLATATARRVLQRAEINRFDRVLARADTWLRDVDARTVLDAATVFESLSAAQDTEAQAQRRRCFHVLQQGQAPSGGWGPFVNSPPEPFDTAVVLLALAADQSGAKRHDEMIRRGRRYLADTQHTDGSWTETTRPPGAESYAQRISTTAWATLALLRTGRPAGRRAPAD